MNLYHVSQSAVRGYDTYSDFVCAAPDEELARNTFPSVLTYEPIDWSEDEPGHGYWANRPQDVRVVLIGIADESVSIGVICSSFHAG
jgi:hypothetical protein